MAGQSSLPKGGAVKSTSQQPEALQGVEVWYEPSPPLIGALLEPSPVPLATGT